MRLPSPRDFGPDPSGPNVAEVAGSAHKCPFPGTIESMSEPSLETPPEEPSVVPPPVERRLRRTMLSTGFSGVPGKTCEICGFQGFRWQTECPEGHPLT